MSELQNRILDFFYALRKKHGPGTMAELADAASAVGAPIESVKAEIDILIGQGLLKCLLSGDHIRISEAGLIVHDSR